MALINYAKREINAKIVYYGPGLCGKTTNIKFVHQKLRPDSRGKLLSLATETDRTLFFDFLPVDLGDVKGFKTRFHLYTVPGQVFYNSTRKMVLKGADGVVFVADSQRDMLDANLQSLANLRENLREQHKDLDTLPMVIQCNKRDLPEIMSLEELDRHLNPRKLPMFPACAAKGEGVVLTLTSIAKMVLHTLRQSIGETVDEATAAGQEMAASYRAVRKEIDRLGVPGAATPPVPVVPPPPAMQLVGLKPPQTHPDGRIQIPVRILLHGQPATYQLRLRISCENGQPHASLEGFVNEDEI